MTLKHIIFAVIGLLFAVFLVQNAQIEELRFIVWSIQTSMAFALLGTFAFGLTTGLTISWLLCKKKQRLEGKDKA
ncbi:MAG: DUF1049 domain-containing protein [Deltaproteobacteria bacterium]|nr:DUF1049 domain-containing protein [Deltaproteobacteria bacterium]